MNNGREHTKIEDGPLHCLNMPQCDAACPEGKIYSIENAIVVLVGQKECKKCWRYGGTNRGIVFCKMCRCGDCEECNERAVMGYHGFTVCPLCDKDISNIDYHECVTKAKPKPKSSLVFTQEHPLKCQMHNKPMYLMRVDWVNDQGCALQKKDKQIVTVQCGDGCKSEFKCSKIEYGRGAFDFKVEL